MKYEVRCECGKAHSVSAADAGGSVRCDCGKVVDVPPLHVLRAEAGQVMLSPAFRLEALLYEGKLPGTRVCAGCHRETNEQIRVSMVCERGTSKAEGGTSDQVSEEGLGCLLGLFNFPNPWADGPREGYRPTKNSGQDIAFIVPLAVCEVCQPALTDPAALRSALCSVPAYAALLDGYPQAQIAKAG